VLTVVHQADGRHRLESRAGRGDLGLLKAVGQPAEEVLPLLVEAQPQVELQLGLDGPARRPEPLLPGKLSADTEDRVRGRMRTEDEFMLLLAQSCY